MKVGFFLSNIQLFYKHSYFSDESMLKIWPEDKSVPIVMEALKWIWGEILQPCFFNVFFSVLYFFLQTASKQQLLWYILFCALPYKSWLYKDANHIRKNKINLALRIAVLSVNGTTQDGIGGNWASPRSTGKAQWHRLAGTPQWGTKGTTQSCR